MDKTGVVCLVGAGPGDSGLITEKGLQRLRSCDAVVYDFLASERLLEEVPEGCRKIYVGKQAGRHSMKQEEINRLLVKLAGEGLFVVRLKGGDPFVFGRGGEEILALADAGIPYEVVSGVTSAVAALASAGIPVTHRGLSQSFHIMTGHTLSEGEMLPADFSAFAKLNGTLIFLMGLGNLSLIVKGLLEQGKMAATPAAVVARGTLPGQKTVRGTLASIEEDVAKAGITSPAIIVVGETAALDFSSTFRLPLEGCLVGVTGTDSFTEKLCREIHLQGGETRRLLHLNIKSFRNSGQGKAAYEKLASYTWLVFTSANGIREFFAGLLESGKDLRALGHVKFAVVGKGTEKELAGHGFYTDYIPDRYQASDLARGLVKILSPRDRLLLPRALKGSKELNAILDQAGISYDDIPFYDVILNEKEDELQPLNCDYLVFASSSGAEAFFERKRPGSESSGLKNLKIVCIGDMTAKALLKYGRKADLTAEVFSSFGIVQAIGSDWEQRRK